MAQIMLGVLFELLFNLFSRKTGGQKKSLIPYSKLPIASKSLPGTLNDSNIISAVYSRFSGGLRGGSVSKK